MCTLERTGTLILLFITGTDVTVAFKSRVADRQGVLTEGIQC